MHFNRRKVTNAKLRISPKGKPKRKKKTRVVKKDIKPIEKPKKKKTGIRMQVKPSGRIKAPERKVYRDLLSWQNVLSGHTAFILGNAPSISDQKLKLLDPYFTIGVNRIFYIYDPTILMWQDRQVWNGDKKTIMKQNAIRICSTTADPRNIFLNFRVKLGPFKLTPDPTRLFGRGNTTALAAQFAIALGCSNIVLLGTDCKYGVKGKTDFYGFNSDHKHYTLKMCRHAMKWLRDKCPVPIYNCSDNDLWPKEKLSNVINKLRPPSIGREGYKALFAK